QINSSSEEAEFDSEQRPLKQGDIVMKHITAITLFALASLITAGSAAAQDHSVQANVPFDFTVGSTVLPAGAYTISTDTAKSPDVLVIQNRQRNIAIFSTAYGSGNQSKTGELVFNRHGGQYFLHEIRCSAAGMNVDLPTSKSEKRAQLQEASNRYSDQSDQVLVALNK
ncbi:MAG: hypothetical protein WA869_36045, partial [Alloacidobacterium sp.]